MNSWIILHIFIIHLNFKIFNLNFDFRKSRKELINQKHKNKLNLSDFEVIEEIGKGATGTVYKVILNPTTY